MTPYSSQPKPVECNRGCGQLVYFDRQSENGYSKTGKMVPLQWDEEKGPTDTGHQCPNSDYNRGRSGTGTTTTTTTSKSSQDYEGMKMILGNTLDILAKVEQLLQRVDAQGREIYRIEKLINPNVDTTLDDSSQQQQPPNDISGN